MRLPALLLASGMLACAGSPPRAAGEDAGLPDVGPAPDAGAPADGGGPDAQSAWDAGDVPDAGPLPDAGGGAIFPDPDWQTGDPAQHGLDPAKLDAAADYAHGIGSLCLLVVRNGKVVYERYWDGASQGSVQKSWSIAKSFTSALVGIAVTRGEIRSIDEPAADFIPSWRGTPKAAIRIRDLLSQDSGIEWDQVSDNLFAPFVYDQTATALALNAAAPPATVWHYSNRAVQTLHEVLRSATGMDPELYAQLYLWNPIGMNLKGAVAEQTHWERDGAGNPTMYMNVYASCRDMARFGWLFRNRGSWKGTQLIAREYVDLALTPSQPLNRAYGLLFWLNGGAPGYDANGDLIDGWLMPTAPPDHFSAQGLGQNFIDVIPSTDTVYVHMRLAPHDPFTKFLTDMAGTLDKLFKDSARVEHRELMRRLLEAG
jgi:CubicO group peptidase (beta-lactamase class C family)